MAETVYDRVNDYGSVKITLASPNDIRSWSFGEVKKPETINYRTYRPEKDGLFCERIFGPERDYECACGKYKGTKYKGIICDRCGVKVTHSRVRRKRMGHINLAAPIVHIWFFKALPSRLGTLMNMKTADLEKVIYFQDYVVTEPGATELEYKQVLTEDDYRAAVEKFGVSAFTALMGAEAVRELLSEMNLSDTAAELRDELTKTRSKQRIKDLSKRLKIVEQIRNSENDPAWMVLDVIPVIPPDLRPLVLLESGNFATSDLNDLYRRIINRNNRLKKLMDLNAPEVIIRNEKRMLQQAVDALFDNGRCRRPVLGSSNRPLKSLTDMIKGKQGRFRENLLGKRVDYSARSVIVVGPELKLHQCGLPKKIALELYQPFIIRRLKEHGLADTIKSAKRMLERRDAEVWDILEQVIYQHPVLLNRAPTLHRMGIQAFEPVLVEGNAIQLHPLVCSGYNAVFDGDQMAVHLPLSVEAQAEAHLLMLSTHNIFSPAHGRPVVSPSQDIVMGMYFITYMDEFDVPEETKLRHFRNTTEALLAYDHKQIDLHEPIVVRLERFDEVVRKETSGPETLPPSRRIITAVGRVIFAEILAQGMPFYNCTLGKKGCSRVIDETYARRGRPATIALLDDMKEVGFKAATTSGLSIGITDLRIPSAKQTLLDETQKKVDRVEKNYDAGAITERERHNQLLDLWAHCREQITKQLVETLRTDRRDPVSGDEVPVASTEGERYLNPVYLMSVSGARGNVSQMQQLAGMRGLMAKPSGEIIETPIRANFREGLNVLEYFSSTHGARKGLADTALKTADSGYLTRKLYDVAQSQVVVEQDCGTKIGIPKRAIYKGEEVDVPLSEAIIGRTSRHNIINPITDEVIVRENDLITNEIASRIEALGIDSVQVRSSLTCDTSGGICALCYGMDMSTGQLVEEGMAVGTIAAQSIGEPGTQLTMRTFHTGGIAARGLVETSYKAMHSGVVELRDCNAVEVEIDGNQVLTSLKRNGEVAVNDDKGRELEKYLVPYGSTIRIRPGDKVRKGQVLVEWDPHRTPILAEKSGVVKFKDIDIGETVREEAVKGGRGQELIVIEHTGEKHPQIIIEDAKGIILDFHHLPAKARIEVVQGETVQAGQMLARQPKEVLGSADIVGGLPRVTEIFEARTPKDPAVTAEISGRVELHSDKRKGKMTIRVISEAGLEHDHHVPQGKHLLVHTGDYISAGDPLTEGPLIPADILRIKGEESLYTYMLDEVQNVYRAQGVPISDKHIEVILRQMLGKVRIQSPGDTELLPNEVVDKFAFRAANAKVANALRISDSGDTDLPVEALVPKDDVKEANALAEAEGKQGAKTKRPRPASAQTLLLGITKASLQAESFLSGASFQETTKVLTEAALRGAVDELTGLKENVLLGHLIPAGTGFEPFAKMKVAKLVEPPSIDDDEEAMLADAAQAAEAMGAEPAPSLVEVLTQSEPQTSISDA
ncbi:MAG: DNA-directed RNA polymerase subunit beta' [Phycisphaerales bacterium]|nr:DNA-directed RNA polymerase subunit beta' [Phycisphaerae bacterium]NNM26647.1 DNA-directed RNA polymerase subunit beta' [Phycisphaerales bacterium]